MAQISRPFSHPPNARACRYLATLMALSLLPTRKRRTGVALVSTIATLLALTVLRARAQEALRDSLTGQAAAQARNVQMESLPYTLKSGDFKLLVAPSLDLNWNDNINIARTGALQDFIVEPQVQLTASYPITAQQVLSLNVGAGYQKYLEHDRYSTLDLQSGSELSFDIYVKDFWFNLHDRGNFIQDTSQQPDLANTANFATINNTAGFSATWDLNKITLSAGYDHQNVIATTTQYESQDSAVEMVYARAGLQVYPGVTTGVETTAAFTSYEYMVLNNNQNYSAGVYADWLPGKALEVQVRGGYTITQIQHTSLSVETSDLPSWYAGLNITHQITDAISYSLDAGHEVQSGIQSDEVEDYYARPSVQWKIIKDVGLTTGLSYEHGNQGEGNVFGNLTETYDWLGANLSVTYSITKRLSTALNYRLTIRSSNLPTDEYTQNVVGIALTYLTP